DSRASPSRPPGLTTTMSHGCGSFGVTAVWLVACLRAGEASVPMVLMCEIGIVEGKPQVEGYAAGELAASAERVAPGLGLLAGMLAELAGGVAGPGAAG